MVALNVTSLGYKGSIDEINGARYFNFLGASRYGVHSHTHLECTISTGDRMVRVMQGTAYAHNILDQVHTATTVQLDAITSGSRWDLIVLRRNPNTSTTSLEVIKGTSRKAIPSLTGGPSAGHPDQPLALCRVQAGQTAVQEIVDLRVWAGNGGATARNEMVLDYYAQLGATITIDNVQWVNRFAPGAKTSQWAPISTYTNAYSLSVEANYSAIGGVSVTWMPNGWRRVDLAVSIRRTNRDGYYPNDALWREMGSRALPAAARGPAVGASQDTIQVTSPLYRYNSRNLMPQEATLAWRIVPRTGELLFNIADPEAYFGSRWNWRVDEQSNINATYFVQ